MDIHWAGGDNSRLHFWKDNWLGYAILDKINTNDSIKIRLRATISNLRIDGTWFIPMTFNRLYPDICANIRDYVLAEGHLDSLIWNKSLDGMVSCQKLDSN